MYFVNRSDFTAFGSFLSSTSGPLDQSTVSLESDNSGETVCAPYGSTNSTKEACEYVINFADVCEGGGYFLWTEYVVCVESNATRYFLLAVAVIFMLYLFLVTSSAADEFFCPSISVIVNHLKISQSVAGVTFMAFGNGAPDIFSTIASVLNTKHPKAGLAIGDLLGGGAFVTTVVFSTIIIVKPFKVARRPTFRDIVFYLVAIGWMAFIMLYDSKLYIWQPIFYLALYLLYVLTIAGGRIYRKIVDKKASSHGSIEPTTPEQTQISENPSKCRRSPSLRSKTSLNPHISGMMEPVSDPERDPDVFVLNIPVGSVNLGNDQAMASKHQDGIFKCELKEIDYDSDDSDPEVFIVAPPSRRQSGRGSMVMSLSEARNHISSAATPTPSISTTDPVTIKRVVKDFLTATNPLKEDFSKASRISKVLQIIKYPVLILFRMTIPESDLWCKPLLILQTFTMPIAALAAFGVFTATPIPKGPGLWVFFLPFSIISTVLLIIFTDYNKEPKYYRHTAAYLGFVMSISWIYAVTSEIVNIISMISVISRLSPEILGLTILAWSNSIGDLVADVSVARQGFPQMAASAAIGGPLFNLLIGFGGSFFIAMVTGRDVDVSFG
ncbi:hypothetical protein FO519_003550 [Halicephalobus sp. NKZ332]|nr:hypothetical protein FO519_003550 [Halicephalobus sp. NKZ332]